MSNYNRIRDLREDENKTQKQISEELYMHLTQYRRYENGEREVPLCVAIQISKLSNVSLDYIAGLTNDTGGLHCNFLDSEKKELLQSWDLLQSSDKDLILAMIDKFVDKKPNENARKSVI